MKDYQHLTDKAYELMLTYGPKIVLAILVLIIGLVIINRFTRVIRKVMEARKINVSLLGFVTSLTNIGFKILLLVSVRPYAKPEDYWDVYFDIYEAGKVALDEARINIPFPQMDVHLTKMD